MTYAPNSLDAHMRRETFAPRQPDRPTEAAVGAYAAGNGQDHRGRAKTAEGGVKGSGIGRSSAKDQNHSATRSGDAEDWGEARAFEKLLAAAKALDPDDNDQIEAICAEASLLTPLQRDQVLRVVSAATGIKLTVLREQEKGGREADELDHLDLAKMTLEGIGRDSILCADQFVWRWSGPGVWTQQDDRAMKQEVQKALDNAKVEVTSARVNGVADVLKTEIYRPEHRFNIGNLETVNCLNGEVELEEKAGR